MVSTSFHAYSYSRMYIWPMQRCMKRRKAHWRKPNSIASSPIPSKLLSPISGRYLKILIHEIITNHNKPTVMFLEINDQSTIKEIQHRFSEEFPFLKIEFYNKAHKKGEGSLGEDKYSHHRRIGEIRTKHHAGSLKLH